MSFAPLESQIIQLPSIHSDKENLVQLKAGTLFL